MDETTPFSRPAARSLNGEWAFRTAPDAPEEAPESPPADWDEARALSVPGAWQEENDLTRYTGVAWYRRRFEAPERNPDERLLLRFGAVDYEATVYCNGERVGRHEGGYLPFTVDATAALRPGENTLSVRVRDPDDLSELPHGKQGDPWYTRVSGIWQAVDVAAVPETRVTTVRATPDLSDDAVHVEVEATGPEAAGEARVVVEREGDTVVAGSCSLEATAEGARGEAVLSIPDADYWTPETPALYDLRVELGADEYADYFGMREFAVEDGTCYLNGEPFRMRGALDQGYYPETLYRPRDLDTYREEILTAKELGFNTLRKHIKPAHPAFLELADRLGILVWEEPANPTVHTEASRTALEEQLWEMVERDYNRPSVAVWSIYNEEWGIGNPQGFTEETSLWEDADKQEHLAERYRELRAETPNRVVCDNSGWAHVATDVNDYHEYFPLPDRDAAWRERLAEMRTNPGGNYGPENPDPDPADVPIIVSEFGNWGLPDPERALEDDPAWAEHDWLEGLKSPAGVGERFENSYLADQYDDTASLAADWQEREFDSVARQIETLRTEGIGYVITEFSDIEWEFNGLLDYARNRKAFTEAFAAVNADVTVVAEPERRTLQAGDTLRADIVVVNDTAGPISGDVEWSCFGESGTVSFDSSGFGVERLADAVEVTAPSVESVATADLDVRLPDGVETSATVAVAPEPDLSGYAVSASGAVAERLSELGANLAPEDEADVAVTTDSTGVGAADLPTVVVPDESGHLATADRELAEGPSWNLCASFLSQTLFEDVGRVPGWAFEGMYPYGTVEPGDGEVVIGYTEGWLHETAGVVVDRGGRVDCALRVLDGGPVGLAALADLVEHVGTSE